MDETGYSTQGTPPRKRSGLRLAIGGFVILFLGTLALFFLINSPDNQTGSPEVVIQDDIVAEAELPETSLPASSRSSESPSPIVSQSPNETVARESLGQEEPSEASENAQGPPNFRIDPSMPALKVSATADAVSLEQLALPPLPYSVYIGAYKDIDESQTTQRELLSNYLPAYIVPVLVNGNVAQSLFGITQDGIWYRILVGHYSSKAEARKILGRMMSERPEGLPEIMKFPYTLDCGRFMEKEEAEHLEKKLFEDNYFPYSQYYPTEDGRVLIRVLVGCFFSSQGALAQRKTLGEKGYSCRIDQR